MSDKIYVGTAKEKVYDDGGIQINIVLSLDGMKDHYEKYGFKTDQGKRKLKLQVTRRKNPDKYGNTHYVTVDTFIPDPNYKQNQSQTPTPPETESAADDFGDDPF
jgi:hypothetical protein